MLRVVILSIITIKYEGINGSSLLGVNLIFIYITKNVVFAKTVMSVMNKTKKYMFIDKLIIRIKL